MEFSHQSRALIVTGAASGIGRAVALRGAVSHTHVALLDIDTAGLEQTAAAVRDAGGDPLVLPTDVTDPDAVAASVARAAQTHGRPTGVASAAGVLTPGRWNEITRGDWQRHFAVNTTGVLNLLQATLPVLADGGAVAVVSSNAARVPRAGMGAYAASKAATSALVRCIGLEVAERGIRCNVVEPGSTRTAMQRDLWPDPVAGEQTALRGDLANHRIGIPLGRIGEADDVAALVEFLLSEQARHLTLQQIYVDGGASL